MYSIPTIHSFEQLILLLHTGPGYDGYVALLKSIDINEGEIEYHCKWSPNNYERIVLERIPGIELILVCWEPGQIGPLHDYASQQGWFYVLEGELTEELFKMPIQPGPMEHKYSDQLYQKGDVGYINDDQGIHRLRNASKNRTISLHIHVDALSVVNEYNEKTGSKEPLVLGL